MCTKLFFQYEPPNWNTYINLERSNKYQANMLKQQEKYIIGLMVRGRKYEGKYPIEIIFRPHFRDKRSDLDNTRVKGVLDGLTACGYIVNDNLKYIQRLVIEPIFDKTRGMELEIRHITIQSEQEV